MVVNVHAGHAESGRNFCGASSYLDESRENRNVKKHLIDYLKNENATVYDCTVDSGSSATNILYNICKKCNSHNVDIDISLHFNAYSKSKSDGKTKGVECWIYDNNSTTAKNIASRICKNISNLGFTNRGVKCNKNYYFLNQTKAQAIIIEICFVDDEDDYKKYLEVGAKEVAKQIAQAVLNTSINANTTSSNNDSFLVEIICSELNVRKNADINSSIVTTVKKGEVFTIIDTKENGVLWGKLKSGAGWISLHSNYTKRL